MFAALRTAIREWILRKMINLVFEDITTNGLSTEDEAFLDAEFTRLSQETP